MMTRALMNDDCTAVLRQLDYYMDNGLDTAATAALLRHLEGCPSCYQELEQRRMLRTRLRAAVGAETVAPSHLATRVLANVKAAENASAWEVWRLRFAGVAAVLALAIALGGAYELGHLRFTTAAQEAYIGKISGRIAGIMRVGLVDHVHCAVFRKYPKNPPSVETFAAKITPEYMPLIGIMKASLPSDYNVYLAHNCGYHGRRYIHLTLTNGSKLVSLVIAQKQPGETFRNSELAAVAANTGLTIYEAGVQRFQITGFETRDHLAYVISDLPAGKNVEIMTAAAPSIRALLAKIES